MLLFVHVFCLFNLGVGFSFVLFHAVLFSGVLLVVQAFRLPNLGLLFQLGFVSCGVVFRRVSLCSGVLCVQSVLLRLSYVFVCFVLFHAVLFSWVLFFAQAFCLSNSGVGFSFVLFLAVLFSGVLFFVQASCLSNVGFWFQFFCSFMRFRFSSVLFHAVSFCSGVLFVQFGCRFQFCFVSCGFVFRRVVLCSGMLFV